MIHQNFDASSAHDRYETHARQMTQEVQTLKLEIDDMARQLAQAHLAHSTSEKRLRDVTQESEAQRRTTDLRMTDLTVTLNDAHLALARVSAENDQLISQLKILRDSSDYFESRLSESEEGLNETRGRLIECTQQNETLSKMLEKLKSSELGSLEQELTRDVARIREEYEFRAAVLTQELEDAKLRIHGLQLRSEDTAEMGYLYRPLALSDSQSQTPHRLGDALGADTIDGADFSTTNIDVTAEFLTAAESSDQGARAVIHKTVCRDDEHQKKEEDGGTQQAGYLDQLFLEVEGLRRALLEKDEELRCLHQRGESLHDETLLGDSPTD